MLVVVGGVGASGDSVVLMIVSWEAGVVLVPVLELLNSADEYEREELEDELDGNVKVDTVVTGPEPGSVAAVVFTTGGVVIVGEEASLESIVPVELDGEGGVSAVVAGPKPGSVAAVVFIAGGVVIVREEVSLESEAPVELTANNGGSVELEFAAVEDVSMTIGFEVEAMATVELNVPVGAGVDVAVVGDSDVDGVSWLIEEFVPAVLAVEEAKLPLVFGLIPAAGIAMEGSSSIVVAFAPPVEDGMLVELGVTLASAFPVDA